MSTNYPNALVVKDLDFGYQRGETLVLSGLSLNLSGGTVLAVVGPNGSGKSTLLHLLSGRLIPWKGKISMYGRIVSDLESKDRGKVVGLVPQSESIPLPYSVPDYVLLGRVPYLDYLSAPLEEDRQLALQCLEDLGVPLLRNRKLDELSAGELRMVQLARTMIQQCRILLLDEPVAHLDLSLRTRMQEIIRLLGQAGKTVVFTTQDFETAAAAADRVLVLGRGRAWAEGAPREALTGENLSDAYGKEVEVRWVEDHPLVSMPG